jgi:hypothetical protein
MEGHVEIAGYKQILDIVQATLIFLSMPKVPVPLAARAKASPVGDNPIRLRFGGGSEFKAAIDRADVGLPAAAPMAVIVAIGAKRG